MPTVAFDELTDFLAAVLEKLGASADDARYMARTAATTEAAGVSTHGAVLVAAYDGQVGKGIDPSARPAVVSERPGTALIDASRGFAPMAMRMAIKLATAKARANGVAMVGVRNTCWLGGLGAYLLPVVEDGLMAMLWAQSSQCKDSVPVGGIDARFSTNPVALAFPTPSGPVVADFSTAIFSMGKVNLMARRGAKAAAPVFFDTTGRLSDDPATMSDGGAMLMAGAPLNEHKGYALSLWCEALTVMGGGSANNPDAEQRQSFNLTVIDPTAFAGADYYRQEMERFVAHVKSSRRRPGVDEIRLPGERFLAQVAQARAEGVQLRPDLLDKLNEIAGRRGVAPLKPLR
ncbi:MAG: Delta(1)-pyrroline-2-carboxylate/Delta(1)-piperideine-2-carboxylate reductase [Phycisphaerae bacterium]|nr:Delta(1)-pyrroline-2-carboxylate/Delta(1)-piperideine-2-carboxylate reductase [Phycisphaerae bacterium]